MRGITFLIATINLPHFCQSSCLMTYNSSITMHGTFFLLQHLILTAFFFKQSIDEHIFPLFLIFLCLRKSLRYDI